MFLRRAAHLVVLLLVLLTMLAGCKHYWGKPGGTAEQFEIDSRECLKESSPTAQMVAYGVRSEQIYRGCLRARGWAREEKPANPPPLGWYRGVEDWD
jgi:hypothetical protein